MLPILFPRLRSRFFEEIPRLLIKFSITDFLTSGSMLVLCIAVHSRHSLRKVSGLVPMAPWCITAAEELESIFYIPIFFSTSVEVTVKNGFSRDSSFDNHKGFTQSLFDMPRQDMRESYFCLKILSPSPARGTLYTVFTKELCRFFP